MGKKKTTKKKTTKKVAEKPLSREEIRHQAALNNLKKAQ